MEVGVVKEVVNGMVVVVVENTGYGDGGFGYAGEGGGTGGAHGRGYNGGGMN